MNIKSRKLCITAKLAAEKSNKAVYVNDFCDYQAINKNNGKMLFLIKFLTELRLVFENPDLKINELATKIAMSERQLYRNFKNYLQITPNVFLQQYRLEKSLELIKKGQPIGNIAYGVGFSSQSYFCHCFKAKYGATPTEFTKILKG